MKSKLYGWQKVYGFSMKQRLKGKAFRIGVTVLFLIALISLPLLSFIGDYTGRTSTKKSEVATLYINEADSEIAGGIKQVLDQSEIYKDIPIVSVDNDQKKKELEETSDGQFSDDVYLDVQVGMGVSYSAYYGNSETISEGEVEDLVEYIANHSKEAILYSEGLNQSMVEALSMEYSYEVNQLVKGENGMEIVEDTGGLGADEYGFSYGLLMAVLLMIMFGASSVADAVVTEKSTRVIEYLLINIKPMAIVLGKILAAVAAVVLELFAVIAGLIVSVIVNGFLFPSEDGTFALPSLVESFLNGRLFANTTVVGIIVAVLIFLLGVVFYGFIAGVAGATVSRVEDTQEGMKLFTMVSVIGAYLALFLIIGEMAAESDFGILNMIVYLLPMSAPFIMPEYLILGKVSLGIGCLSLAIMIVSILVLLILVSNIYGALIYHRGAPLKLKDIIGISKAERGHK